MYIAYTLVKRNHLPPSFIQTKIRTNWLGNLCLISFKKALFFRKLLHQPYHSITMKDKNQKCNFEFFLAFTLLLSGTISKWLVFKYKRLNAIRYHYLKIAFLNMRNTFCCFEFNYYVNFLFKMIITCRWICPLSCFRKSFFFRWTDVDIRDSRIVVPLKHNACIPLRFNIECKIIYIR